MRRCRKRRRVIRKEGWEVYESGDNTKRKRYQARDTTVLLRAIKENMSWVRGKHGDDVEQSWGARGGMG